MLFVCLRRVTIDDENLDKRYENKLIRQLTSSCLTEVYMLQLASNLIKHTLIAKFYMRIMLYRTLTIFISCPHGSKTNVLRNS